METSALFTLIIDYIGTFAFAISGIRRASAKQFDLFGAVVVGFATACGGGTFRDLLLGKTPFWMNWQDPMTGGFSYLLVVLFALIFVIALGRWLLRINETIFIFDAIGLGLFTVVGIEKSLQCGFPVWVGIIMGMITGAGGGIIRDIFINVEPLVFRKDIYATACVFGGIVYWVGYHFGLPSVPLQILTAIAVIGLRCVAMKYHWTLPQLRRDVAEFDTNDLAPWRRYTRAGTVADDMAHFNLSVVATSLDDIATLNETDVEYVELATSMEEGGLTPSRVLIQAACEQSRAPVRVIVRPNSQGYVYTDDEFSRMLSDVQYVREQRNAEGVCLGILTRDNTIDIERMKIVKERAGHLKITFNRAFERTNQMEAYKQLEAIGIDCVLVPFNADIDKLPRAPITLRVAGGVTPMQLPALSKEGLTHIHMGRAVRKGLSYNQAIDTSKVWEFIHV